jgi:GTP-binding protein
MRSIRAIENADVCMLMVDATLGIEGQDLNILGLIQKNSKGVVILVNKWDLIEKETQSLKEFEDALRKKIEPFTDVPILFISALTKQRIHKALEMAVRVFENRIRKIQTSKLNEMMLAEIERHAPPATKGKFVKIKYITQLPTHSPSFAFFCNLPQYVKEPYQRYLENRIRDHYDFHGVPIKVFFRKK